MSTPPPDARDSGTTAVPSPVRAHGDERRPVHLSLAQEVGRAHITAGVLGIVLIAVLGLAASRQGLFLIQAPSAFGATMLYRAVWWPEDLPTSLIHARWILSYARERPQFAQAMTATQLTVCALLTIVGYGLRRLQRWAWWAAVVAWSAAVFLSIMHAIIFLYMNPYHPTNINAAWTALGAVTLVGAPLLVVLLGPKIRDVFRSGVGPAPPPEPWSRPARRRGNLLIPFLRNLLMVAVGLGMLVLLALGPLVEVAWAIAWLVRG